VYDFLDPHKEHGKLAAYIVGIAVAECIIFALVYGIIVLREKLIAIFCQSKAVRDKTTSEKRQGLDARGRHQKKLRPDLV
jgi:hypothetical protein